MLAQIQSTPPVELDESRASDGQLGRLLHPSKSSHLARRRLTAATGQRQPRAASRAMPAEAQTQGSPSASGPPCVSPDPCIPC